MAILLEHPLAQQALLWASSEEPPFVPSENACFTRDVFRARLDSLVLRLRKSGVSDEKIALTDAVLSEIGNNAFDHNIGNWRDVPGIFFGNDMSQHALFVIADRGQGIRTTLSQVRSDLTTDEEALKVAFTERVSGRAPERRGNGLKFVRHVLLHDGLDLWFSSGTANYQVVDRREIWNASDTAVPGCCAILTSHSS